MTESPAPTRWPRYVAVVVGSLVGRRGVGLGVDRPLPLGMGHRSQRV